MLIQICNSSVREAGRSLAKGQAGLHFKTLSQNTGTKWKGCLGLQREEEQDPQTTGGSVPVYLTYLEAHLSGSLSGARQGPLMPKALPQPLPAPWPAASAGYARPWRPPGIPSEQGLTGIVLAGAGPGPAAEQESEGGGWRPLTFRHRLY